MKPGFKNDDLTFQQIVESSPNVILLVDGSGIITYANRQTGKLLGYTSDELIGMPVDELIPHRIRANHTHFRMAYLSAPTLRAMGAGRELFALRKDGTEVPIEISLNSLETAGGMLTLASIHDITERRRAEEQFRQVVESVPNAIVLVDAQGVIALINRQAERLFGYPRSELIGKQIEVLIPERFTAAHPGHRKVFYQSPETRPMGAGRDLFALRKDGSEVQVEIGLSPIQSQGKSMVLASVIDITARKQQEDMLKRKAELESRNRELEQFAYIASHDLREPLRTISNYVDLLEEDFGAILSEEAHRYLHSIKAASSRLSHHVRLLLDFARLGVGKKPVSINVNDVVRSAQADLKAMIERTGTTIAVKALPTLNAFEDELRTLFLNLIVNAIKFRNPNEAPFIQIACDPQPGEWQFSVTDNGIGIEPSHHERIFEVFQRLHPASVYDGSGIGLSICKRVVELHQGKIWVASQPGLGSTFYFTIPDPLKAS